jgi:N-acetylglutamate synthase-like GNAT family acetyltransferase
MSNSLDIKLLTECQEHIPALAELWFEEISRHWIPNANIKRAEQNLFKHSNAEKMPMTFVALLEGKPIGMASLRENDGIQPECIPWLGSLVVHPKYRNRKIGEALIEAINNQAKVFGYEKIYLLAFDQTIPIWYARLGWKIIGKDILFSHPVTVMSYSLLEPRRVVE